MERERLGRLLSLAVIPCGLVLIPLALLVGDVAVATVGIVAVGTGLGLYSRADVLFDPDAEFDLRSDQSFITVLTQSGLTLVMFGLLVYLVGDVQAMMSLFRDGVSSPTLAAAGVTAGVILGGGVAALTQWSDTVAEKSQSFTVRMVGFSLTFGTFLVLMLYQPPSSLIYAAAYMLSRLAVVLGIYLRS